MNNIPLLALKNVCRTFQKGGQDLHILHDVSLDIKAGQKIAIVGPSGSGKSTLLYLMGLLDKPTSGQVFYKEEDLTSKRDKYCAHLRNKKFGFIYQHHYLLAEFSALENVIMPAVIAGANKKQAKERGITLLKDVGLEERLHHYPAQLSGGEQQRVAVARALYHQPEVLFADEPTGNLDEENTQKVYQIFDELVEKSGSALVLVTHNHMLAQRCDLVYTIHQGQCTLEK